jgi:hypothetical protein
MSVDLANCTICQDPLQNGFLSKFLSLPNRPFRYPCDSRHQVHQGCFQLAVNSAIRQSKQTIACPTCRKVTPISIKTSEFVIIKWVTNVELFAALFGQIGVLPVAVTLFGRVAKAINTHPNFENTALTALRKGPFLHILSLAFITGMQKISSMITTRLIERSSSALVDRMTALYNWLYELKIKPSHVKLIRASLLVDSQIQIRDVCNNRLNSGKKIVLSLLKSRCFDTSQKQLLSPWINELRGLKFADSINRRFQEYLSENFADMHAKILTGYRFYTLEDSDEDSDSELLSESAMYAALFLEKTLKDRLLTAENSKAVSSCVFVFILEDLKSRASEEQAIKLGEIQNEYKVNSPILDLENFDGLLSDNNLRNKAIGIIRNKLGDSHELAHFFARIIDEDEAPES